MDPHEIASEVGANNAKTELPDTLRRPKHQKNKVSWGPNSPPAPTSPEARTCPAPPLSPVGPTSPKDDMDLSSHISDPALQAAMKGRPLMDSTRETLAGMNELSNEANMLIQETLDEIDPTSASSASKSHPFMQLPESVTSDVFEQPQNVPPPKRIHRATPSTAEDLFRLTADLADLNQQLNQEETNVKSPATLRDPSRRADLLVQMGTSKRNLLRRSMVFSRRNLLMGVEEDGPSATITETGGSISQEANHEGNGNVKKDDSLRGDNMHDLEEGKKMDANKTQTQQRLRTAKAAKNSTKGRIKSQYREFEDWLNLKRPGVIRYMRTVLFFLIIPATAVAAILYYAADNPPCGTAEECEMANSITAQPTVVVDATAGVSQQQEVAVPASVLNSTITNATVTEAPTEAPKADVEEFVTNAVSFFQSASASWWILFICVRLVVTLSLSYMTEAFLIDFLTLRSKWAVTLFGPFVTLFLVQSHGWPLLSMFWGAYNFALLYGPNRFAEHWGYWQTWIGLFNEENPSGSVTSSGEYRTLLIILVVLGFVVAVKRFCVTLFLGKQTYTRYAEELAKVMKKALILGQVSGLARDKAELGLNYDDLSIHLDINQAQSEEAEEDSMADQSDNLRTDDGDGDTTSPHLTAFKAARAVSIHRQLISDLLGDWEEPGVASRNESESPPISALIQFRQSIMSSLHTNYPFSYAFGPAANRYECVESSQALYDKLVGDDETLKFDLLALLAVDKHEQLDQQLVKDMIKLFRPDREGRMSKIDFVRSVDTVYKEMRLLRANIMNSSKMDRSFETIINVGFYFLVTLCVAAALGIDPLVLLGSVSAFVIGFAFMIGSAASSYFEGILYVLARRPYDIGDAIAVSNPTVDTPLGGNVPWFVTDVNLYTTTAQYGPTNEIATIANGMLAKTRVINFNRAKRANVLIFLKFSVDAPYPKLRVFRAAVEKYVKNRPREWSALLAFRADWMFGEQGAVQWLLLLQHRRPWQEIGDVLDSRGEMMCFSCELAKKLDIIYHQPAMPIEFTPGSVRPAATSEITLPVLGENSGGPPPSAAMSPTPLSGPATRSARMPRYNSDDLQDVTSMFKKRFDVPI